ncbi:MAG: hypothetical protein R2774_02465 [Saprospiraceae bacterium]
MSLIKEVSYFFQEVELPVIVSDEYLSTFETENPPLPIEFIDAILTWEKDVDEFTEYVSCFRLPDTGKYIGLVYWRGKLYTYDFFLATLDLNGKLISCKSIGGTHIDPNGTVTRSIASIEEDLTIKIMIGQSKDGVQYSANQSKSYFLEILENGEITMPMEDE